MLEIADLKFDEKGLIPVVVQDVDSKKVLTVAYMNQESLALTLKTGFMTYYSRSRQELWKKGETSGNYQHLVNLKADCDRDSLVAIVSKDGPACHLDTDSCFNDYLYCKNEAVEFSLDELAKLIATRQTEPKEGSYTSYLFEKGLEKILKKVGEESTEVIIGAMKEDKAETTFELADLTYHLLVLMINQKISLQDVQKELAKRHIVDHKVKQETMQ